MLTFFGFGICSDLWRGFQHIVRLEQLARCLGSNRATLLAKL